MTKSITNSVLKFSSSIALAVMTLVGVGVVDGSQSARLAGGKAATAPSTSEMLKLACHNSDHHCPPTCGVRG